MIDGCGRKIDYIRISLTDRCNLRCAYCMPREGLSLTPEKELLTFEEVRRAAEVFASIGITGIKLTGGEPLMRPGVSRLVKELKEIPGIRQVTLTTNGTRLPEHIAELAEAGIDGINISLDTLNPKAFEQITGRACFEETWKGVEAALKYPQIVLKVNCVLTGIPGQNELELAELPQKYPVHLRYIEMMPMGLGRNYSGKKEDEVLKELEKRYGTSQPCQEVLGNGPGHYFEFPGFLGKVGFISAISHKFCDSCNRVRLTCRGALKTCLQYEEGMDLRELLRNGSSGEELEEAIWKSILKKPAGHRFFEEKKSTEHEEKRMMSQIGG